MPATTPVFLTDQRGNAVAAGGGGDASAANQATGNTSLASIDTKTPTVGQKVMSGSRPVVIASDQSTLPVNNLQIGGVAVAVGSGVNGTGVQRVTIATDQAALAFIQSPPPAGGSQVLLPNQQNNLLAAATLIKGSAGRLLRYRVYNPNAAVAYVQLFNAASAAGVTPGTTAPLEVISVPAGAVLDTDLDYSFAYPLGIVVMAATTPTGATALTTGLVATFGYV